MSRDDAAQFMLPGVDDPADIEIGVILMGFDARLLLTGLGVLAFADDPADAAMVALTIDRLRHGVSHSFTEDEAVAAGWQRWCAVRPAMAAIDAGADFVSAAPRQAWARVVRVVDAAHLGELDPASRSYLAACWLRRDEIDACCGGYPCPT